MSDDGLFKRACEVVSHDAGCPAQGRGDEHCQCDAVAVLNDLEATFLGFRPSAEERRAIAELSVAQELSHGAVIRQALRLYQLSHYRHMAGETCSWSGDAGRAQDFAHATTSKDRPMQKHDVSVTQADREAAKRRFP